MASRNRNRPGLHKEDADEERALWHEVRSNGKRIDQQVAEHNKLWAKMQDLKGLLDSANSRDEDPSPELEDELMTITRANVKLCDEIIAALEGESDQDGSALINGLHILTALRASSEAENATPQPRGSASSKPGRNAKRKADTASQISADDRESMQAESPIASSPKVLISASSRLKVGNANSRSGSVPAVREASVKIEEGNDSGLDGIKQTPAHGPPKYKVGTEVLYRTKQKSTHNNKSRSIQEQEGMDGEGILCEVTTIIGESKQRRYEIRDIDPEVSTPPYRASLNQMTPIPPKNEKLPDLPPKKAVLALYPNTTTFYKAEVVKCELERQIVRLRFEGEEDPNSETEVERRYVLVDWTGK
ncbi:hypothetical protein EG327_003381 [Venturia inaequalis]|uniref:SGF29 C-terminal domain-containing protein n=1 Tax=Venturia inaequalis TaxID=5025 RepID=A0A8H3VE68_VENIN|nr:hypothetical protein EG327_003381 [Venturia inaequalis]